METAQFLTGSPAARRAPEAAAFSIADALKEPGQDPLISPARYIDMLKLDIGTFAKHAHVHRNTVTRAPGAASVQGYLRQNIRVLAAALNASGDLGKALQWFRNEPLPPFAYKTAEQLVADGRADDVIRLIDSYAGGAAG
jgi:hypothetical protein